MKMAQFEVEKLNGCGSLQGMWGAHSVRPGIVWCLVPCGDGEVRGQVFQRGPGFSVAAQRKVVINKCFSRED